MVWRLAEAVKILLIEDHACASGSVERELGEVGFQVEVAVDWQRGVTRALDGSHAVVLLDLLPAEVNGNRILSELRRRRVAVPVLVLSGDGIRDRVRALNDGADDVLVKPFSFDELAARVRALARRGQGLATVLAVADLRMELHTRRVERAGRAISLTAKEFALLRFLLKNHDAVVTRVMIAEHVWGRRSACLSNVIDVYIRYLRAKVDADRAFKLIHTLRGVGYMLSEAHP